MSLLRTHTIGGIFNEKKRQIVDGRDIRTVPQWQHR